MLKEGIINSKEFKDFWTNLCCESYPREVTSEEKDELEARWPRFHERLGTNSSDAVTWCENRFGRIPPFIWQDQGREYSRLDPSSGDGHRTEYTTRLQKAEKLLREDSAVYAEKFRRALLENQKCAQHHIHRKNKATGTRMIPNACQSKKDPNRCKHDFPNANARESEATRCLCAKVLRSDGN